ncbi:hypothetical protein [Pseudonocardia parietis]|uniref:Flp pilus assembly pilin Flp n=1 Tax=Pseudonocardia parietis TaxID=570936 RepID=A0ABS4VVJ0_9PSEU|nr:hypothetical protein [Pseudonocardia parietis]MBP2367926.1 Flp pilus assembly pilin Flp [Pseudonocardia parietis]
MTADPHDTAPGTRPGDGRVTTVRGARRAMIVAVVASLVVASAMGIVALLSGEFGDLQVRIVLSTLVVAGFGTTALCHLAVVTRTVRVVGFAGLVASGGAALAALVLIWQDWSQASSEGLVKALLLLTVAAVSLAHANLLLLLADRGHPAIRVGLVATLLAIAVVAVMLALPVLTDGEIPGSDDGWYWRWLGVAGIVDALGTIALPVLGLVLRPAEFTPASPPPSPPEPTEPESTELTESVRLVLDLPPELAARLDVHAGGGSMENAALDVLHRGLR